jgi:hypothetical protein
VGAALLWRHFDFIYYKDELSYLSAASKYARGELEGVNSYWAPLLSLELAPLLALGVSPELSAVIVKIFNGLFALEGARSLVRVMGTREWLASVLDLVLVVVTLYCAMPFMSADLLLAGLLTWYFSIVFRRDYPSRRHAGIVAGLLGGAAYYAKSYAFFFFVAHFAFVNAAHALWGDEAARAGVRRHLRVGYSVFAALVALWVGAMYAKYHVVTLGITGKYNYQIVGPDARDRPILQIGFDAEPRPGNTSAWEEPADFYRVPSALECCLKEWSPLSSARALKHQFRLIRSNVAVTLQDVRDFSSLSYAVILLCVLLCVPGREEARRHLPLVLALGTVALYPAGYLLVVVEERYLWPMLYLLVAISGYLLSMGFATPFLASPLRRLIIVTVLAVSFVKTPIGRLRDARDFGRSTSQFVEALRGANLQLRGKRIASNVDYGASDIISFYYAAKYIGQKKPGDLAPDDLHNALKLARVDYYFVWGGTSQPAAPNFDRVRDVNVVPSRGGPKTLTILRPL